MNDTPKKWKDMTDAEKGALLLAHHGGLVIETRYPAINMAWIRVPAPSWDANAAYRIAPPKFLPPDVGKVYRTADGVDRVCIAVRGETAWLSHHAIGTAYMWNATDGMAICLGYGRDIIGLSENQEISQ